MQGQHDLIQEINMVTVKVLGSGCANCKRLEQIANKVIQTLAIEAEVLKVTDYQEITDYGILSTPGLVVNEKVVSSGRIPSEAEITTWLADALETA
jgi:small redox-active disulfide protein 2